MNEKRKKVIENNIEKINKDIHIHSKTPEVVKLVVVTKFAELEDVEILYELGLRDYGENKVQKIKEKKEYFENKKNDIKWNFIGNLQKNKVKYIAEDICLIHSINKLSLASEIEKQGKKHNRVIKGLIEINISNEEGKEGYILEEFLEDIPEYLKMENLKIVGLMAMAPFTSDDEIIRTVFSKMKKLLEELNCRFFKGELVELSMGMSNDYKIALEEGATIIRVGTKIFEEEKWEK